MNGGGGNYAPGNGASNNNRGRNFGGNPGQRNSIDYMRAVSSLNVISRTFFCGIIMGAGASWSRMELVTNSCSHFVYLLKKHVFIYLLLTLTCLFLLCNVLSLFLS